MLAHRTDIAPTTRVKRALAALAAGALACLAVALAPASASAAYAYYPGDPMYFGGPARNPSCTGGYVVRGGSGTFLLTAGHCANAGSTVFGTGSGFGTVAYSYCPVSSNCLSDSNYGKDTELVREWAPNYAYQTVRDPRSGRLPGVTGKVVGWLPKSYFTKGFLVGKMGKTTGWTEGAVFGLLWWHNMLAYCTHAKADHGDSGGPVWRTAPGGGVYALGIEVAIYTQTHDSCFIPIDELLKLWGAQLPVWTHAASKAAFRRTSVEKPGSSSLPMLDPRKAKAL